MTEYYVDLRCKVKADDIQMALKKISHVEDKIKTDDDVTYYFVKSVGQCLEQKDKMVGDRYEG